jgi:hypothetical protein
MAPLRPLALLALVLASSAVFAAPFGPARTISPLISVPGDVELAYVGDSVVALWIEGSVLHSAVAGGRTSREIAAGVERVGVAWSEDRALVVWTQTSGAVMAVPLESDGSIGGSIVRIGTAEGSFAVAVAYGSGRYVAAWAGPLDAVYAAALSPAGGIVVPAMPVSTQAAAGIGAVEMASNGERFAVVWYLWTSPLEVFATTLSDNAVPLSMTPIRLGAGAIPDVTSDGSGFMAVWGGGTQPGIVGRRLSPSGEILREVRFTSEIDTAPRVAWDGSAYTIAYRHYVEPRPGFAFNILTVYRFAASGAYVESLRPDSGILFIGEIDLIARDGRVDLMWGGSLQTAEVEWPFARRRPTRH